MQEYERLFPQEDEEGVAELWDFGQHEQRCPKARHSVVGYETESVLATLGKEWINQNVISGKVHRQADIKLGYGIQLFPVEAKTRIILWH